jgi:hypothetical protein
MTAIDALVGTLAGTLLVGSWSVVTWRRYQLLRLYRDRRAWSAFTLALILLAAATAFAAQQLVSIILDGGEGGLRLQFLLVGMGIGALTWGGVIEALYLLRRR